MNPPSHDLDGQGREMNVVLWGVLDVAMSGDLFGGKGIIVNIALEVVVGITLVWSKGHLGPKEIQRSATVLFFTRFLRALVYMWTSVTMMWITNEFYNLKNPPLVFSSCKVMARCHLRFSTFLTVKRNYQMKV